MCPLRAYLVNGDGADAPQGHFFLRFIGEADAPVLTYEECRSDGASVHERPQSDRPFGRRPRCCDGDRF